MGKVPTLVDADAVVTEAAAICPYLADKFAERGSGPATDSPDRGRYYRYLFFRVSLSNRCCRTIHSAWTICGRSAWDGWTCRARWPPSSR